MFNFDRPSGQNVKTNSSKFQLQILKVEVINKYIHFDFSIYFSTLENNLGKSHQNVDLNILHLHCDIVQSEVQTG